MVSDARSVAILEITKSPLTYAELKYMCKKDEVAYSGIAK